MADVVCDGIWSAALEALCPPDHEYKLALFDIELEADASYEAKYEMRGDGYTPGGATLTGRRIVYENGVAALHFDRNVQWLNAEIRARSALVYDATANRPLRVIDFTRTVGVMGGLFEVRLPEQGVLRLGKNGEKE